MSKNKYFGAWNHFYLEILRTFYFFINNSWNNSKRKKERKTTEVSEWAFCSEPQAWLWLPEALQTPAYKVLIPKVTAAMVPLGLPPWSGPGHTAQQAQLLMRRSPLRSPAAKQMLETISVKQNKNVTKYREVLTGRTAAGPLLLPP